MSYPAAPMYLDESDPKGLTPLKLSDLLGYVKSVLHSAFSDSYWITAEVSNISQSAHNAHVYIDLVETEKGVNKAYIRGNLWAGIAARVLPHFQQVTGGRITIGMQLLMLVRVDMHPRYGISLTIYDINPEYTLGHLEKTRQETIARLQKEGVWDLNRQCQLPFLVQRVAVITSATAAGWGDFQKQIAQSPVGKLLRLTLFSSMMQGKGTTASISKALDTISSRLSDFDAIVVIRGGGSKMDLSAFDDYQLCCLIANFPLPVISGIGHEKDISVVDMVAHTMLKTPTAVAEFLLRRMERIVLQLFNAEERVEQILLERLETMRQMVEHLSHQSQYALGRVKQASLIQISDFQASLEKVLSKRVRGEEQRLAQMESRLLQQLEVARSRGREQHQAISFFGQRLYQWLSALPKRLTDQLDLSERLIHLYDPQNVMKRGFLPVLREGSSLLSVEEVKLGDELRILVIDGEIATNVNSIRRSGNE